MAVAGQCAQSDASARRTGSRARKPWKEFSPPDKVGLIGYESFYLTPDANHFVLAHVHVLSSIFVAEYLQ
jgi:hypothetical protein